MPSGTLPPLDLLVSDVTLRLRQLESYPRVGAEVTRPMLLPITVLSALA